MKFLILILQREKIPWYCHEIPGTSICSNAIVDATVGFPTKCLLEECLCLRHCHGISATPEAGVFRRLN